MGSVLKIDNLNLVRTDNQSILIKEVSLQINAGDVVLLAGRNGVGKTTLLNALTNNYGNDGNVYARFSGQFDIAGAAPDNKLFERIIYIPQNDYISFPFVTAYKALAEGYPSNKKIAKNYVDNWLIKYSPFLDKVEKEALLKKKVGKLSGGERKYIAILQSLLRCDNTEIKLIILDEPINNLDANHIRLLSNLLLKIKNNNPQLGFLIVSHCCAFPYITSVYEIKETKLCKGMYCCGTCFGDTDDQGYYLI